MRASTVSPPTTCWPTDHLQLGVRRQEDVHARSEFHQADPLAAFELLPFADAAHDPPREDADDLPDDDGLAVVVDPDLVQLVVVRGFVVRRQELARPVLDFRDRDRRPACGSCGRPSATGRS